MDNIKQLKETAEKKVLNVIRELMNMNSLYGIDKIYKAITALQSVRSDLSINLDEINKPTE